MIQINLLPQEDRIRETPRHPVFSISITFTILILVIVFAANLNAYFRNKRQLAFALDNLKSIRVNSEQSQTITQQLQNTVRPEAKLIQSLLSNEMNWAQILALMSTHIPNSLWLSKLELKDEQEGWNITIIGFARSVANASPISAVGEFTTTLKKEIGAILAQENIVADIELLTTTKRKIAEKDQIIEFKASFVRTR